MNSYLLLSIAIISEVFGSSMLKASEGFRRLLPSLGVAAGLGLAFYCLSLSLQNIPLGTAYAIWSGAGTALTATVGIVFYKESINAKKLLGLLLVIAGVAVMKLATDGAH
ncbi:DMT family transporter ['Paenibacillus yunnanensis' Narsing Rao et al. 2020]|uniref:DMT family transporter n=1 Tax=Paenibacillus tengchongensis TaxID=2608684 RepID=UPI00124EDD15|nr:multidrug efflux SMR transporter [Paenibacillus tengchongensis]